MSEFEKFPKIQNIDKMFMLITQKIHGSNAQIVVQEDGTLLTGSRNRWVTVGNDNFGFAAFCQENREEIAAILGPGRHYGEWAGPGINSGEGLAEKTLVLFSPGRYEDLETDLNITTVPVLYKGRFCHQMIDLVMKDLKVTGSKLSPGFMRPEGIVIETLGQRLKKVFEPEETKWTKSSPKPARKPTIDLSDLMQPKRLEKLLSKDERYTLDYPENLPQIVGDYISDLKEEGHIDNYDAIKKPLSSQTFQFVKAWILNNEV